MKNYKFFAKTFAICLMILTLSSCTYYQPMPLTPEAIKQTLSVPPNDVIRIKISQFRHPILKPIPFDYNNGLSPDEAAVLAVIYNPLLKAARDARGIATAQVLQAGILPNPQVSLSFETPIGQNASDKKNALSIGLEWDISSLAVRNANIAAAHYHATSIDLEIAWQEWQVAEAAKLQVFRLFIAEKRFALTKKIKCLAESLYKAVETGVNMGAETTKTLLTAWKIRQNARQRFLQAQEEVISERLALNKILGLPSSKNIKLEKGIHLPTIKNIPPIQKLLKDVKKTRLDLLALRYGYKSQEERLRAAIQSWFPKISLGLIGAQDTDGVKTIGIGINISFPIFDKGQGRISFERATRQQLFDEYTARLFEARANIVKIIEMLHSTHKQLQNLGREIFNLQQLIKYYRKGVNQGNISIIEYYQVLLQKYAKELQKLTLQRRLVDLAIGLEIATGRYIFTGSKSTEIMLKPYSNSEDSK